MKIKNKFGFLQIFISYIFLWIPLIIKFFTKILNKDIFIICLMLSLLTMVDAKMKYNNIFVKLNYFIIFFLLIIFFILIMI